MVPFLLHDCMTNFHIKFSLLHFGLLTPWKESYDQPRQHIEKQRHYFVNKGLSSQGYGFFQWSGMDVRVGL